MRSIILCLALQIAAPIAAIQANLFEMPSLPAVTEVASLAVGGIQEQPNAPAEEAKPSPPPEVNIEVNEADTDSGFAVSPMWLAIGGIGLLLLIVLIVMAVRNSRGETTVVRQ